MNNDIEASFQRIMAHAQKRAAEFNAFLATQPQSIPCEAHPEVSRPLDSERSKTRTADRGRDCAAYAPCPLCEAEIVAEQESERLAAMGIPSNLFHATLENWQPATEQSEGHLSKVREFIRVRRGTLIMLGSFGTGKSHLAAAVARGYRAAWFVKQSTLLRDLRRTYDDRNAPDPIERAKRAALFALDELGVSGGGRDEIPMLAEILDYRHCERKPTIVTSNLSLPELRTAVGPRIADRWRESNFAILQFDGDSHRRDARSRYFDEQ
jgi:DNA replication protein DnaC